MTKKVLFIDVVHPILAERLTTLGYSCEYDYYADKQEIEAKIKNYFGIVIRSRIPIDKVFLNAASHLKFIARSGAGLENIDIAYAEKKGIKIFNSPEGNMDAVGEHAIGMLLMLFNQLKQGDKEVRQGIWNREKNRGIELAKKIVGIVGYGNMGSAFAKKLVGFDCQIIAYDKYKTGFTNNFVKEVNLPTLFNETDILSIHLPLSTETYHFVNKLFIEKFKKPFYLINTARGNNVCIADLVDALKNNKILGACLDVLAYETTSFASIKAKKLPQDFKYLTQSDKIILSPHVAGWTKESYLKLANFLADKIEKEFG